MSGSQRRSEYATVGFDLALEGRFSALIRAGEVGGKESLFYLKSGKPQEVTLRRVFFVAASRQTHKSIHRPTRMCSEGPAEEHTIPQTQLVCTWMAGSDG